MQFKHDKLFTTQSTDHFRKLILPKKTEVALIYSRLSQAQATRKNNEKKQARLLFKKRKPDQKDIANESNSSENSDKSIVKELLKNEVSDWDNFMVKDKETIRQIQLQDSIEYEEQGYQWKTQETTKRNKVPNERYAFFQKMKLGNKLLTNLSQEDFLTSVRQSTKLNDYAKIYKQQPNNIFLSLTTSQQAKVPKSFGLIQNTKQIINVNTSRCLRSSEDCRVFSNAMVTQQSKTITTLQMNHNLFDPQQLRDLLLSFPLTLKEIELIDCKLNYQHMDALMSYVNKNQIYKINLEQNQIRDQGCKIIMKYLMSNNTLQYLNLNQNQITESACLVISNLLKQTQRLLELYLGFNNLNATAGNIIWKAMYKNTSVKIIDLSHNNISSLECAISISKAISRPYNELVHVDLSYNRFTQQQTTLISDALIKNETIYGFHFEGNQSDILVNVCGFLINQTQVSKERNDKLNKLSKQPQYFKLLDEPKLPQQMSSKRILTDEFAFPMSRSRKIRSTKSLNQKNNSQIQSFKRDSCWICEGWQEIKFEWIPYKSGILHNEPIFIHFDFEDYRPLLMTHLNGEFFFVKMCPPNQTIYYFFTNPIIGFQQPAQDQPIRQFDTFIPSLPFLYNDELLVDSNNIEQVNILKTTNKQQLFDKYMPLVQSKPREPMAKFDFSPYLGFKKSNWSVETSIFRQFQPDTQELIDECFEFDFQNSKVTRLVKENEIGEVKEQLKLFYRNLFHTYKYHVSGSLNTPIPCIMIQDFMDLLVQTSLIENMKTNDIEISFTSTSAAKDVQFPQAYEKGLVRCQLLEIMIRICNDKYIRTGIFNTMAESIEAVKNQCQEYFNKIDHSQYWRKTRLWIQKCDITLNDRLPFLKSLFKYICKLSKKPPQMKQDFISIQDFKDWANQSKIISDELSERECYLVYLQSMMTQKDELYQPRHYQMNFSEFIEACGRLAEKLSIIRGDKPLDLEDRRVKDLNIKLDGFLLWIYLNIGNEIKSTLSDKDIVGIDKCMINDFKSLKQKLEDSFTDGDEPPYDPKVELPFLSNQITNLLGNVIGMKKQTLRQQIKQLKKDEQRFSLINIVQYFKKIQKMQLEDEEL